MEASIKNNEIIPIFVMGVPRSGTTFLASSIASHDEVVALPEMHFVYNLLSKAYFSPKLSVEDIVEILLDDFYFRSFKLFKDEQNLYDFTRNKTPQEIILGLVDKYNKKNTNKTYKFWLEHSPHSHQHIELILHFFPNSKFIHIVRDPRAVIYSNFREPWGVKDVISGADNWNKTVMSVLSKSITYDIFTIKYEDIMKSPVQSFNSLASFVGLNYSDVFLNNSGVLTPEAFNKSTSFNGAAIDPTRNAKWVKGLKHFEISHIERFCGDLMKWFDYPFECGSRKEITGLYRSILLIYGKIRHLVSNSLFQKKMDKLF